MSYLCNECGVDTWEIHEFYAVKDEVWFQAMGGDGSLCIGCLEKRLGRALESNDFHPKVPINVYSTTPHCHNPKSDRLKARLGGLFAWPEEELPLYAVETEHHKKRTAAYVRNPKNYKYVAFNFRQELMRIRLQKTKQKDKRSRRRSGADESNGAHWQSASRIYQTKVKLTT